LLALAAPLPQAICLPWCLHCHYHSDNAKYEIIP